MALGSVIAAASCGKGASRPSLAELAEQVNAAVPPKWKDQFSLTPGTIDADGFRYTLLVPRGWVQHKVHEGTVVPPDNNDVLDASPVFGFNNEVVVSSQCGGDCQPGRDWRAVSDAQLFAQLRDGRVLGTVLSDEAQANGRLVIFQREPEKGTDVKVTPQTKARLVMRVWWDKKGSSYHLCQGTLSDISYELAPVMAAACMSATAAPVPSGAK